MEALRHARRRRIPATSTPRRHRVDVASSGFSLDPGRSDPGPNLAGNVAVHAGHVVV